VLDTFLVASIAILLGSLACLEPVPVAAATVLALAFAWPRLRLLQIAPAIALFAVGALRAPAQISAFDRDRGSARAALVAHARCAGPVEVASSPARVRDSHVFVARAIDLTCDEPARVAPGTCLRLYAQDDDLARGDRLFVIASVGVAEVPRNPGLESAHASAARTGVLLSGGALDTRLERRRNLSLGSWIDRARRHARRRIDATYPRDAAPMARALVLGESDLEPADTEAFRASGLSHILAVSGAHVIVAVLGLVRALESVLRRVERLCASLEVGRVAAAIGVPLAWLYADFAGAGGSVRRAAAMATAALLARALGRRPDGARAFALSLLGGALVDPLAAFDVSFCLSAAATAGLLLLSRPIEAFLARLPAPVRWAREPLAATLAATLCCAPWLAILSPSVSLAGLVANVVAVPLGEAISLPACLGHLLLAPWPAAERGVALLASGSLLVVRAIARLGAAASWAAVAVPRPTSMQLALLGVVAVALFTRRPKDRLLAGALGAFAYLVLEVFAVRAGQPKGAVRITFLDVGQGDSALVDLPDGRAMLVDGGGAVGSPVDPGRSIVAPFLRSRRRPRVDAAVLTHPHPDHFVGLASALPTVGVGELWDNGQGERTDAGPTYRALIEGARRRGVPVLRPRELCGKPRAFGGAEVRVLAPCPGLDASSNANDNSLVLRIAYGDRAALLVGDAEEGEEQRLLELDPGALRADLLKVGHHGSGTSSSPRFLDAVRPSAAVISCGVRNRFGHPHPRTLGALESRGVRVFRTDRAGAVVWWTDGLAARVHAAVPEPG
jgi:competence protein ComEC